MVQRGGTGPRAHPRSRCAPSIHERPEHAAAPPRGNRPPRRPRPRRAAATEVHGEDGVERAQAPSRVGAQTRRALRQSASGAFAVSVRSCLRWRRGTRIPCARECRSPASRPRPRWPSRPRIPCARECRSATSIAPTRAPPCSAHRCRGGRHERATRLLLVARLERTPRARHSPRTHRALTAHSPRTHRALTACAGDGAGPACRARTRGHGDQGRPRGAEVGVARGGGRAAGGASDAGRLVPTLPAGPPAARARRADFLHVRSGSAACSPP